MSGSKNLASYPQTMFDVVELICDNKETVTLNFPDERRALAARLQYYSFVRALGLAEHSLGKEVKTLRFLVRGPRLIIESINLGELEKMHAKAFEDHLIKVGKAATKAAK